MRVTKMIESDARATMWEIRKDPRWWTVALIHKSGEWIVTSDKGNAIKAGGKTGLMLIDAVRSKLANDEKMRAVGACLNR